MFARCRTFLSLAALACLTPFSLNAADADPLLRDALAAEARFDSKTALDLFLRLDAARPNDPLILQKLSRQYSDLTLDAPDVAEKKRLCTAALTYAQRAVALRPTDPVNVLSLAICYGKLATYADTRTKIEYSRHVREHAERALALDPAYDYAHHVLGRWHYEVASLGAATRFIVKLIYGGLPNASTAEAVRLLTRATELAPQLPSHRVELGFALLADGQRAAAKTAFEQALALPQQEKYDDEARRRARTALEKLR
jgi:tetratricopeptide (TPR) repeat protein